MYSRDLGMGAYHSLGYGSESINANPATLSLYKHYEIDLGGSYDITRGYGFAGASISDSQTAEWAMGLSYHFVSYGGDERRWAHVTTAAFALPIANLVHLGAAVKHHFISGSNSSNSVTMNAGVAVHLFDLVSVGFSAQNVIGVYNRDIPRYFIASASAQLFNQLTPAVDVRMDFNNPSARVSVSGGLEWLIAELIPLRAGYTWDGIDNRQYLHMGVGYFMQGSGIDIAYRHEFTGGNGRMLSLTLKVQFGSP